MNYSDFVIIQKEKKLHHELYKLEAQFKESGSKYNQNRYAYKIIDKINEILLYKGEKIDLSLIELKTRYEQWI